MFISDCPKLQCVLEAESFQGYDLHGTDASFLKARSALVDDLVNALEVRFADTRHGVAKASHLTKLECWPMSKSDAIEGVILDNQNMFRSFLCC
jgi:hypothetical protein